MPGATVTLPSEWSAANAAALGCQCNAGSSANGVVVAPSSPRVGRYDAYFGSPTGASTLSESHPPGTKTETSTRPPGPEAARAMPSSNAPIPSFDAPYTETASAAERSTKERRDSPVPAGTGIPASTAGSPSPARAAAARSSCEREKSRQWSAISAGLVLGGGGDELAQRVLPHRSVDGLGERRRVGRDAVRGEPLEQRP